MSTLCLHHHDADGRASGAIVRRALGQEVTMIEMDYGDPVPWESIDQASNVVIVDFSLPLKDMKRIADRRRLTWIDHHKTSIEEMKVAAEDWPGIRQLDEAACVLTWQHFFPDTPVPKAVVLIGDRDIWRWTEAQTGPFSEGLYQQDTSVDNEGLWEPLLDDDPKMVNQLIMKGSILRASQLKIIRRKVARYGQEIIFEGYRTLLVNDRGSGEMGDHINQLGYQIGYCYIDNLQDGKLTTFITLYSKEVDVSIIARKFGGGGHVGAAGFSFVREDTPFPPDADISS